MGFNFIIYSINMYIVQGKISRECVSWRGEEVEKSNRRRSCGGVRGAGGL